MKFGIYFAYWEQEWTADYVHYCEKAANIGFDVLEIAAGSLADMTDKQLDEIKRAAAANGILLTACIGLPSKYNVASLDEKVRRCGIEYVKSLMDAMEKAGCTILGGILYAYWPADYSRPIYKQQEREKSIQSIRELGAYAGEKNISLMLETVNRFEQYIINDADEAIRYALEVNRPNVKVMLDSFHMNIEEDSFGDAIRKTNGLLGHFHIGEANRKVPGKGHMAWEEIGSALRDIHYSGCVVMEPFVKTGGTVGRDIKVFRDLTVGGADVLDRDISESLQFVKRIFLNLRH